MVDEKGVSNISFNQIIGGVSSPEILIKVRFTYIFKHALTVKDKMLCNNIKPNI